MNFEQKIAEVFENKNTQFFAMLGGAGLMLASGYQFAKGNVVDAYAAGVVGVETLGVSIASPDIAEYFNQQSNQEPEVHSTN